MYIELEIEISFCCVSFLVFPITGFLLLLSPICRDSAPRAANEIQKRRLGLVKGRVLTARSIPVSDSAYFITVSGFIDLE